MNDRIIVSTIVPLYKGDIYVHSMVEQCMRSYEQAGIIGNAELIFINDYPDQKIEIPDNKYVYLYNNEKNCGIHKSRSIGIKKARGKWIHFLDQDDSISIDFYKSQLELPDDSDIIVSNAIIKDRGYNRVFYRNWIEKFIVRHGFFYIELDNRIISPGQCLIKKSSIPPVWCDHCMSVNGADDFLLWLYMFDERCNITVNPEPLYTHEFTGSNLSADTTKMINSMNELFHLYSLYSTNKKNVKALQKKIRFINGDYSTIDGKIRRIVLILRKGIVRLVDKMHIYGDNKNE